MKKLSVLALILTLVLSLSGCGINLIRNVYENETGETLPSMPEGEVVTDYYYWLYDVTVTDAEGNIYHTEYLYTDVVGENRSAVQRRVGAVYYLNDEEIGRESYTHDAHGSIISIISEEEAPRTFEYTYDEYGHILEETARSNDETLYTAVYTYDSLGNTVSEEYQTKQDTNRAEYTYDEKNRVTEIRSILNGSLISYTVTTYAQNSRPATVTTYDANGKIMQYEEYIQNGSYETITVYANDETILRRMENTYSHADLLVKQEIYNPNGMLLSTSVWNYLTSSYTYMKYE